MFATILSQAANGLLGAIQKLELAECQPGLSPEDHAANQADLEGARALHRELIHRAARALSVDGLRSSLTRDGSPGSFPSTDGPFLVG